MDVIVLTESFGCFFFQAEDGIRGLVRSRGLGDVYKRQVSEWAQDHEDRGQRGEEGGQRGSDVRREGGQGHDDEGHQALSLIHI